MKRDMDLIRKLLLAVEAHPYKGYAGEPSYLDPQIEGYTPEEVGYHTMLLKQAELIEARRIVFGSGKIIWRIQWLNWDGHEFLDTARDQNKWNQAKKMISEKGGSLTFDILKGVLAQLARQAVGL